MPLPSTEMHNRIALNPFNRITQDTPDIDGGISFESVDVASVVKPTKASEG